MTRNMEKGDFKHIAQTVWRIPALPQWLDGCRHLLQGLNRGLTVDQNEYITQGFETRSQQKTSNIASTVTWITLV